MGWKCQFWWPFIAHRIIQGISCQLMSQIHVTVTTLTDTLIVAVREQVFPIPLQILNDLLSAVIASPNATFVWPSFDIWVTSAGNMVVLGIRWLDTFKPKQNLRDDLMGLQITANGRDKSLCPKINEGRTGQGRSGCSVIMDLIQWRAS